MKRGGKMFVCLLGVIALTTAVRAVNNNHPVAETSPQPEATTEQPYSPIWERNVFDLKPAPTAIAPPTTNLPPPNVKLVGITTIFGNKRALLSVQEQIPGQPPKKEESYTLTEGERRGGLEVLEIDPKSRTVKIKNDELVSTITFETNKTSGGLGSMAAGGPPHAGFAHPPASPMNNGGPSPLPARTLRPSNNFTPTSSQDGYGQPNYQSGGYAPTGNAGLSIPGSLFNQPSSLQAVPAVPVPSPEEQIALVTIQNQIHAAEIANGTMPPFPQIPGANDVSGNSQTSTGTGNSIAPVTTPNLPPWLKSPRVTGTLAPPLP